MKAYLPEDHIIVVEQADDKPFNRAKLLNIGALNSSSTHIVFHDVDLLPVKVSYVERPNVTQIAFSDIQLVDYLGGVTMFERSVFERVGGYHNDYFHRAEDNEMMFHLKRMNIPVLNRFGIFKQLPHIRTGPEFIAELWKKAQIPRKVNMLETCKYTVIGTESKDGYVHTRVSL